jgi:hypothetical protein
MSTAGKKGSTQISRSLLRQEIRANGQAFRIRSLPGSCRLNSIVIR